MASDAFTIQKHVLEVNKYNLPLVCYESGQGLSGSTTNTIKLQKGVQADIRMKSIYLNYFNMLFNNSVAHVNHYSDTSLYNKYGSWGMFQYADERLNGSAKWNGTLQYLQDH